MGSSKKGSNGRSPLVNPQRQITAFFCKKADPSPSPSPSPSAVLSKRNPNPKEMPSPITPSPLQSKRKPVLVISPQLASAPSRGNPISDKKPYDAEVVGRRIRVYWPLDKTWYEGCVKSFDKISGKHAVQYDDAEEETLNLLEEKIEWIEEPVKKKLRRLRKFTVVEDEEEVEEEDHEELEDDSDDEDWGGKVENETVGDEDGSDDTDLEIGMEEEEEEEKTRGGSGARKNVNARKRKVGKGEQMRSLSSKKSRICEESKNKNGSSTDFTRSARKLVEPTKRISPDSK